MGSYMDFGCMDAGRTGRRRSKSGCGLTIFLGLVSALMWVAAVSCTAVTYDHRALVIDGKRRFLQSASIHYPRSTPQMWPQLIENAKQGGIDVIQTYVFWDVHEPEKGKYDFTGRYDLVRFIKVAADAGLYVNLRIGPYVCAEWNFGGFPSWLRWIPGIQLRTDNAPFKAEMEGFVSKIVNLMKGEKLFASQGGPIILAQIENEYGNIQSSYGDAGHSYIQWAASMAESLDTGVPWIMCQQEDAPANIINTCNGFYCDYFSPNAHGKPKMWTENWSGWFHDWGKKLPHRPVEDVAYAVARFFEKGGSFQNYYMYHGGTNLERTAGEWIATSYDYDGPLDEYGQIRQPKWGHLKDLHAVIKLCEPALVIVDEDPYYANLGPTVEVHVYGNGNGNSLDEFVKSSEVCAAFLANFGNSSSETVQFNSISYDVPAWSVSILPDCKSVVFNTAKVGVQTTVTKMLPVKSNTCTSQLQHSMDNEHANKAWTPSEWETYREPVANWGNTFTHSGGVLEQINTTKDTTDYLWLTTTVEMDDSPGSVTIGVHNVKDTVHFFVNGAYAGSPSESFLESVYMDVKLNKGHNTISILSMTLGLQNYGPFLEAETAGFARVELVGLRNLTEQEWTYQVGLQGEQLKLYTEGGEGGVSWQSGAPPTEQPLTWYKTRIDAPGGNGPVALDLGSMGKGQAWINGNLIGRFWTVLQTTWPETVGGCSDVCDYRGNYSSHKCTTGCGEVSQRWYHVPRDWLQPTGNLLVVFEETGGDTSGVSLGTQVTHTVCAHVSDTHPAPVGSWARTSSESGFTTQTRPLVQLNCSPGHTISQLNFVSYGNPSGTCGSFEVGTCHSPQSTDFLRQMCVGRQQCSVEVSWASFETEDPCPSTEKSLAVEAVCLTVSEPDC